MKRAARETLKYELLANGKRAAALNTVVFTSHILNTNVLFGKLDWELLRPSEEGGVF
jgi:hypothetical protein